jgi:hypothetical protein
MKLKLYTTVEAGRSDYVGLNQIISRWEEDGLIERIQIPMKPDGRRISWVEEVGYLALEPSDPLKISDPYKLCLTNQYRKNLYGHDKRILPWHFYVRDLKSYEEVMKMHVSKTKTHESIFSGTIRGDDHTRNLWINSTEIWSHVPARRYTYTNQKYPTVKDYYMDMASCKYGLALGGDGGPVSVCQREYEYMGQGVVPIVDPHVSMDWHNPPEENVHYLTAKNPKEMQEKIADISQDQWEAMSDACYCYYVDYISPKGLWSTVMETINGPIET